MLRPNPDTETKFIHICIPVMPRIRSPRKHCTVPEERREQGSPYPSPAQHRQSTWQPT